MHKSLHYVLNHLSTTHGADPFVTHGDDTKDDTKELSERQKVIVSLIQEDDTITIDEMIQKANVSSITIKRDLSVLQKLNILKREGGRKQGRWVIVVKGNEGKA